MSPSYVQPLRLAWSRTRRILIDEFDIGRWLVMAFAAFLASLAAGGPESVANFHWKAGDLDEIRWNELPELFGGWMLLGVPLIGLGIVLFVLCLWVGSRGKLIFLDNLVFEREAIVEPWGRLGPLGNSLFVWTLCFWVVGSLLMVLIFSPMVLVTEWFGDTDAGGPFAVLVLISMALLGLVIAVIAAYVLLFLDSFVVPIMYRDNVRATEGWAKFLTLFRQRPVDFILYGFVVLLGFIVFGICFAVVMVFATCATCCIAPVLMSIPYISSVLLLPLLATYRLYSVEFLRQFGEEYFAFPAAVDPSTANP